MQENEQNQQNELSDSSDINLPSPLQTSPSFLQRGGRGVIREAGGEAGPGGDERPSGEAGTGGEASLSISQKKEWARELFIRDDATQKAIAEKIGVSEQAMSRWVKEENWDALRKTLLSTRQEQLKMLYDILDGLNRQAKESLLDDDPETNPNTDGIIKITNAIKKLEKETGIGEMVDTARSLISFVQRQDHQAAKIINTWFDIFIKDRLKTYKS